MGERLLTNRQTAFQNLVRRNINTVRISTPGVDELFTAWRQALASEEEADRLRIFSDSAAKIGDGDLAISGLQRVNDVLGRDIVPGAPPVTVLRARLDRDQEWRASRSRFLCAMGLELRPERDGAPMTVLPRQKDGPIEFRIAGQVLDLVVVEAADLTLGGRIRELEYRVGQPRPASSA